ncbi:MAG: hypothetical protein HYX76_03970 [Acidobacteria bacterium]|nr:hypothetical protein [Acidobacteriota bacterium]
MTHEPTSLAEEGFLAGEVTAVVAAIRAKYSAHFRQLSALNRLLTGAQYDLRAHPESAQELTCAVLFVRSLAHCQAVLILIERGMLGPGRAIARCALEGLFNLGACAADAKLALSFIDADQLERKRRAKYLGQVQDPQARARLDQAELEAILGAVQARIDEVEAKELKTRSTAKAAGPEDMYLTAYAMLSGAVHSTVGDLDQHFRIDQNGRMEMLTEPATEHLEGVLLIVGETMVGMVRAVSKVFDLGIADRCEEWLTEFQKLYATTG